MSINLPAPIAFAPEEFIFASDNTLKTSSLKVAEAFGKFHKDVLEKIKNLDCSEDFRQRNFTPTQIETGMPTGGIRKDPAYEMTKDGFMFLVMGFTGKKAAAVKEAYISAFNLMHERLFSSAIAPKDQKRYTIEEFQEVMALRNYEFVNMNTHVAIPRQDFEHLTSVVKKISSGF